MTVAELIERLKELPQDLPVCTYDEQWGEGEVLEAEIQTVYLGDFKYVKTKGVVLRC